MLKKRVVAAVAAALVAGGASAVTVNPDGVGDFLIAPAFFIGGGLSTELQVINTSSTQSTVAKLVFRSKDNSGELLDFLIYLSPNDVWNGKISCLEANPAGVCTKSVVESADDSTMLPTGSAFATKETPFRIESSLAGQYGLSSFTNEGYVDIEMGPAFDIAPNQIAAGKDGVTKAAVRAAYLARLTTNTVVTNTQTPNILSGTVRVTVPGHGVASIPMLALADYNSNKLPIVGELSGLDLASQDTTLSDVEEAIWKNNIVVPYSLTNGGFSLATVTFPTKLTWRFNIDGNQFRFKPASIVDPIAPVSFKVAVYNNEEQSISRNVSPRPVDLSWTEMDFKLFAPLGTRGAIETPYESGWARITFASPQPVRSQSTPADNRNFKVAGPRVGGPVIATYMIKGANGDLTWSYASSNFN